MKNVLLALSLVVPCLTSQFAFADDDDDVTKNCYLKTCEFTGDFNGDGFKDQAVLVTNKEGKKGIKITFGANSGNVNKVIILGAGHVQGPTVTSQDVSGTATSTGKGGDDFSWMTDWSLEEKNFRRPGHKGVPHVLRGNALHLEKSQTSFVRAYWNGANSVWDEVEH